LTSQIEYEIGVCEVFCCCYFILFHNVADASIRCFAQHRLTLYVHGGRLPGKYNNKNTVFEVPFELSKCFHLSPFPPLSTSTSESKKYVALVEFSQNAKLMMSKSNWLIGLASEFRKKAFSIKCLGYSSVKSQWKTIDSSNSDENLKSDCHFYCTLYIL
jgi:hypothetical protein